MGLNFFLDVSLLVLAAVFTAIGNELQAISTLLVVVALNLMQINYGYGGPEYDESE